MMHVLVKMIALTVEKARDVGINISGRADFAFMLFSTAVSLSKNSVLFSLQAGILSQEEVL